MKNKVLKYIKSIFTQFKDLSIPQIIFFIIGLAFWIIDLIKIIDYWPDFDLLIKFENYRLNYSYMFVFLTFTVIFYIIQVFFRKINNTTIMINLLVNIPFNLVDALFFLVFGWGNY